MKIGIRKELINAYIVAFGLFSLIPAYYAWNPQLLALIAGVVGLLVVVDIILHGACDKNASAFYFLFIMLIYTYISKKSFWGSIELLSLVPFAFARKEYICNVFDAFVKIFAICMFVSIPVYLLVVWFHVSLPGHEIPALNSGKLGIYTAYPFLVTYNEFFLSPRFFGWFDEPGVVGTLSAIILVADKFNFNNKANIVVLASGILSMSLFFFLICGVYLLFFASNKVKLLTIAIILVLVLALFNNELLYESLFRRFLIEDGEMAGMNREWGDFHEFFSNFRHTDAYWTGLGPGAGAKYNEGGSSYKQMIVNYGVIYFILYLLAYYLMAISRMKGVIKLFFFSVILLGTMYQRPFAEVPTIVFLMIASTFVISKNYSNKLKTLY